MSKILKTSFIALGTTLVLSGCSSFIPNLFANSDINGDGTVSQGELAMSLYTQRLADGSFANITDAQIAGSGVTGVAVGTTTPVSAASVVGNYKLGTVKLAANHATVEIQVDGDTYTMFTNAAPTTGTINGRTYTAYRFGATGNGDRAGVLNGDYSSLTYFLKNATLDGTGHLTSYDAMSMIATGLETPDGQLPTQIVSYSGYYVLLVGTTESSDDFTVSVNFNTDKMTGTLGSGLSQTNVDAGLTGNRFSGTVTSGVTAPTGMNGEIVGAFYGPNAEEILGTVSGTAAGQGGSGYIIGNKN